MSSSTAFSTSWRTETCVYVSGKSGRARVCVYRASERTTKSLGSSLFDESPSHSSRRTCTMTCTSCVFSLVPSNVLWNTHGIPPRNPHPWNIHEEHLTHGTPITQAGNVCKLHGVLWNFYEPLTVLFCVSMCIAWNIDGFAMIEPEPRYPINTYVYRTIHIETNRRLKRPRT